MQEAVGTRMRAVSNFMNFGNDTNGDAEDESGTAVKSGNASPSKFKYNVTFVDEKNIVKNAKNSPRRSLDGDYKEFIVG